MQPTFSPIFCLVTIPELHFQYETFCLLFQVLLIGGSTGTMLEALDVVGGDSPNDSPLASIGSVPASFATNNVG